jgi:hypothetical protein
MADYARSALSRTTQKLSFITVAILVPLGAALGTSGCSLMVDLQGLAGSGAASAPLADPPADAGSDEELDAGGSVTPQGGGDAGAPSGVADASAPPTVDASSAPDSSTTPDASPGKDASGGVHDAGVDSSPSSSVPSPGTTFRIVNRASGTCLEGNGGTGSGTPLDIHTCDLTPQQTFELLDTGGGIYNIVNPSSGNCIDVSSSGTQNGTQVQIWQCDQTPAQTFVFQALGSGNYLIINTNSQSCASTQDTWQTNGTPIILWTCQGDLTQEWQFLVP